MTRRERILGAGALALSLVGYAASRWLYYREIGLELDAATIHWFWQYLPVEALRDHPLEAVYWQHTQPPLFNLLLAATLRTSSPDEAYQWAAWGFGIALHGALHALLVGLGVRRAVAVVVVWIAAFEPASALLESWVFYTYPTAALVTVAAACLVWALRRPSGGLLFAAFLTMAVVVATRSLFHLAWMVLAVGLVLAFVRHRRRTLALAAVPLALAAAVYVKNAVVFGQPEASSWLGFSLSRLTTTRVPSAARRALIEEGALSELGDDLPWWPLYGYPPSWRALPDDLPADELVLTQVRKPGGFPNLNHGAYVAISRQFLADARVSLARRPDVYLEATELAWRLYFLPIHDYSFFHDRRRGAGPEMRRIEEVYEALAGADAWIGWEWSQPMPPLRERTGWAWAWMLGLAVLFAFAVAWRDRRPHVRVGLLFTAITIVMVAVVGNSLELGENNRFRFLAQPLSWALLALLVDRALRSIARLASTSRAR